MNLTTQNAKNLISKDHEISSNAAKSIIDGCDFESFKTICENSNELYDFIKDKIINNLVNNFNKQNLDTTFEFAKLYSNDFEQIVLAPWLKFASEDLTDEILEIFENGCDDEKIYAAKYFQKINDPIALDALNFNAKSQNEELFCACAKTLSVFGDTKIKEEYLEVLKNSNDDFAKYKASLFLINYGDKNSIEKIVEHIEDNAFSANIANEILYDLTFDFSENLEIKLKLADEIIQAYPEDLPLETIFDFNFNKFCDLMLENTNNPRCHRILTDFKNIIDTISENNIYTYDLAKQNVQDIKDIANKIKDFNCDINIIKNEFNGNNIQVLRAINTIYKLKEPLKNEILKTANNTQNITILCECAKYAKKFNFTNELNKNKLLEKIKDTNAKALFESYFN